MPVERFRTIAEMPRLPRPSGQALLRAIAAVWEQAHLRGPLPLVRGVNKFRTLEEANASRAEQRSAHMQRLRKAQD